MKINILLFFISISISFGYAQNVNGLLFDATNTATRDASAAFEINANTNTPGSPLYGGLLLPRVALTGTTDATTISGAEATSLLVYNTATVSDVIPGFYYWESGAWKRIIAGNSTFPTGSGTTNYLARWLTANTLGIGVTYDNGTNVGIGIASPLGRLDVQGTTVRTGTHATSPSFYVTGSLTPGQTGPAAGNIEFRHDNGTQGIGFGYNSIYQTGSNVNQELNLLSRGNSPITLNAYAYSTGNVGIGTASPSSILDVYRPTGVSLLADAIKVHRPGSYGQYAFMAYAQSSSDAYFGSVYTGSPGVYGQMYFRQYTQAGVFRDAMFIKTDGNIGIGNTNPSYTLDVTGNTRTTGKFFGHLNVDDTRSVNTPPTGYNYEVAFDFKDRSVLNSAPGSGTYGGLMTMAPWGDNSGDASHQLLFNEGGIYWRQGQPDAATWDSWTQVLTTAPGGGGTPNYLARWITANQLGIGVAYDDGTNVGIGITLPQKRLDVLSNVNDFVTVGANTFGVGQWTGIHFGYRENNSSYRKSAIVFERTDNSGGGGNAAGKIHILNGPATGAGSATLADARLTIGENGNVGIGETAPGARLEVDGIAANWNETTPGLTKGSLHLDPGATAANLGSSITWGAHDASGGDNAQAGIYVRSDGSYGTKMYFATTDAYVTGSKTRMYIGADGNVGIATTAPGKKFDVQGLAAIGTNYITGAVLDVGRTDVDYPGNSGWNGTWNSNILLSGLDNTSITFHDAGVSVGALNYKANQFSFDGAGTWGPASVGINTRTPQGKLDVTGDIFGVNEYSFQGCTESIKDWDYSGLNINPTCNGASDDSWYIQSNSNEWSRGVLSRRRFSRTPGLTLEYEAYLQQPIGGNVHYMIGFVDGNSTSYSYCQNPSNLMYHDHAGLSVYENCVGQGSNYSFDTRNAWYKFKVVLKGAGANYYVFYNGSWRLVLSTANNSNKYVRILISAYNNRLYIRNMKVYQSDFNNFDATGVNASAAQYVPSNSGAVEVSMGSYPAVSKGGDPSSASNATLVMGSITVSGNDIRFANGIGGLGFPGTNSVQNLAHGMASFTVSLEKRINGGGWVSVYSQSAMCAFAVGDYYMQANGLTNAFGISGDMYRYPNSVSFSYFDTDATVGNYEYRLVFTPGGYNKLNGYNYSITQRNLTAIQIKR